MKRWILAAGVVAVAVGIDGRAEYPTLKARPKPLAGIPNYPYEASSIPPKASVTGTGQSRINVGEPTVPGTAVPAGIPTTTTRDTVTCRTVTSCRKTERIETRERVTTTGVAEVLPTEAATFVVRDQALRVDHCSVSGISVTLYPDGKYAVRFRAEQGTTVPLTPLRRNLFVLTVRGYAADPNGQGTIPATMAAVLQIPVDPFWVNRGEPYQGFVEGTSESVRRNYKWVDRIDVDFTYR